MRTHLAGALLLLGTGALAGYAAPGVADDFTVTTTADRANGLGTCQSGDCSLREAIIAANLTAGADTITLPAGTFTLSIAGADEESALTGDLDITDSVTITGQGRNSTLIDGNDLDRVFHLVPDGSTAITVTLRNLTIQNGTAQNSVGGGLLVAQRVTANLVDVDVSDNVADNPANAANQPGATGQGLGGGIYNTGTLNLTNVGVYDNAANVNQEAEGALGGGGIYSASESRATLMTTVVSRNVATNAYADFVLGGGILNQGTMTIQNSTIGGAQEADGNQSHSGAGIANLGGELVITESTVQYNRTTTTPVSPPGTPDTSGHSGGGVFAQNAGNDVGNVVITKSTVSNNYSDRQGGGIFNSGAPLAVSFSTISDNEAQFIGGGISNVSNVPAELTNSTVYGNIAANEGGGLYTSSNIALASVTLAANVAESGAQVFAKDNSSGSSGVAAPQITLTSTIIAHQNSNSTAAQNCGAAVRINDEESETADPGPYILSREFNIDSGSSCGFGSADGFSEMSDTDPLLDPNGLLDNGGPTRTVALQPGSPAAEHREADGCPSVDQRGYRRQGLCDTGSYELDATEASFTSYDLKTTIVENQGDPVQLNEQFVYTFRVQNMLGDAAAGVSLAITLPGTAEGLSDEVFVQVIDGSGSCTHTTTANEIRVQCDLGSISGYTSARIGVTVTPTAVGTLVVSATAQGADVEGDAFKGNNSATERTTVSADTGVLFPSTGSGGGSADAWLAMLLGAWAWRRRRTSLGEFGRYVRQTAS